MSFSGTTVTITQTTDGYELELYPVQTVDVNQRKSSFSIAPPGQAARENIFLSISGMNADIVIDAVLWDDGTDRSNGTAPSDGILSGEVVTLQEQYYWLDQYIHNPDIAAAWELSDSDGWFIGADGTAGEEVFFENYDTTIIGEENERWKPVRLTFRRGRNVG